MKTFITSLLLAVLACGPTYAKNPESSPLATIQSTCSGQPAATQSIKLYRNGSVDAKTTEGGVTSTMRVEVNGNIVTMTQMLPYGTITRRFDMDAFRHYLEQHPTIAKADQKEYQSFVKMMQSNCKSTTNFQPTATSAGV